MNGKENAMAGYKPVARQLLAAALFFTMVFLTGTVKAQAYARAEAFTLCGKEYQVSEMTVGDPFGSDVESSVIRKKGSSYKTLFTVKGSLSYLENAGKKALLLFEKGSDKTQTWIFDGKKICKKINGKLDVVSCKGNAAVCICEKGADRGDAFTLLTLNLATLKRKTICADTLAAKAFGNRVYYVQQGAKGRLTVKSCTLKGKNSRTVCKAGKRKTGETVTLKKGCLKVGKKTYRW